MIEKRVSKMKMIDVCRQTELSERTVRYYVQRGLLHPISGEKGERTYMDFSSTDVRRLEQVAALRKAGFSIEEILNMIQSPDTIPAIVMDRRHELAQTCLLYTSPPGPGGGVHQIGHGNAAEPPNSGADIPAISIDFRQTYSADIRW